MAAAAMHRWDGIETVDNGDWQLAHEKLVGLARTRAGLDFDEGKWLVAALRTGAHLRLGYGSFVEYIERLFGYGPRFTQEKLRVAEALEDLPLLSQVLRDGAASWSVLRELTRVATPETEQAWADAALGRTARDVERLVSGHRPGSRPDDSADATAPRHVLRFEVSGEVLASFREAIAKLRRDAGGPIDDDDALLLMARQVLGGPNDEGRASYQVALTVCEKCQGTQQHGRGELVEVSPEVAAMARCDAQHIGSIHVGDITHVGDANEPHTRAKQDVSPALRRFVLRRDEQRCKFPGCRHATFVDIHHIETRAEGGAHEADNLITVCIAHHRAIHRGEVVVEGRVSTGLRFRHADGTDYGGAMSATAASARALAFQGLRKMGFGEGETRRALAEVCAHVGDWASIERLLRAALLTLTGRSLKHAS